ncbi:unnamed protein product, partial [Polarella glacialis]
VLIHSVRGQSRSCCVLSAYMMRKYGWGLRKTMEFLSFRRPDMNLKPAFMQQLSGLERRLASQSKLPLSIDWADADFSRLECEELLLRNTYLNSQMGPLAEFHVGGVERPRQLIWLDHDSGDKLRLEKPAGADRHNLILGEPVPQASPALRGVLKKRGGGNRGPALAQAPAAAPASVQAPSQARRLDMSAWEQDLANASGDEDVEFEGDDMPARGIGKPSSPRHEARPPDIFRVYQWRVPNPVPVIMPPFVTSLAQRMTASLPGTIFFIRHGQSEVNRACYELDHCDPKRDRVYYRPEFLDSRLSDVGKAQAAALQSQFGAGCFQADFVLVSTLYRSLETATIGLSTHIDNGKANGDGPAWIALDSLRESDEEAPPRQGADIRAPKACNHRRSLTEDGKFTAFGHVDFRRFCSDEDTMGSETTEELTARVMQFARELKDILKSEQEQQMETRSSFHVVVVSHYVFLHRLISLLEGEGSDIDLPNCAVKEVQLEKIWKLLT